MLRNDFNTSDLPIQMTKIYIAYKQMNVFHSFNSTNNLASLSTHENICTIELINIPTSTVSGNMTANDK